jgi:tryptophan-rich sensory protein
MASRSRFEVTYEAGKNRDQWKFTILFVVLVAAFIFGIGSLIWSLKKNEGDYRKLKDQSSDFWQPASAVFYWVWVVLYVLQAVAITKLVQSGRDGRTPVLLVVAQLVLGWMWMLTFKDSSGSSVLSILGMSVFILMAALLAARICPTASIALAPTFVWLSYAGVLAARAHGHGSTEELRREHGAPDEPKLEVQAGLTQPESRVEDGALAEGESRVEGGMPAEAKHSADTELFQTLALTQPHVVSDPHAHAVNPSKHLDMLPLPCVR